MAATTKNLKDLLPAQNPRRSHRRSYPIHNAPTHTEAFLHSQPSSSQALSRSHCFHKHAFSRPRNPFTEQRFPPQQSSSISLSRPRLIDSTMPLPISKPSIPPCLSQHRRKPVLGYNNEDWVATYGSSTPQRTLTPKQ